MTTLTQCFICDGHYSLMREHCPYCGARKVFTGSDGPVNHIVNRGDDGPGYPWRPTTREIVRAVRTDLAFNFVKRA